jgi:alanyl-tRNA synthetase
VIDKGLKADEWTKVVSEILGGKSGGKGMSAQASGPNVNNVQKAMEVAQQFANSKLQN